MLPLFLNGKLFHVAVLYCLWFMRCTSLAPDGLVRRSCRKHLISSPGCVICRVTLRAGAKITGYLCFCPRHHATTRAGHVWETGLSDRPVGTQGNDTRAKGPNDCKTRIDVPKQPFALTQELRQSSLVFMARLEENGGIVLVGQRGNSGSERLGNRPVSCPVWTRISRLFDRKLYC